MKIVEIGESNLKIADGNYSSKYPRSEEFITEGVPFIRGNNFENKSISDKDMYFISPEKHSELKKGHVKPKDVLITTRGNIGKVALVPERHDDSNINAQIVLLRCNEGWHPEYLLHTFNSDFVKRQIPGLTTGTALKQLPVKNLKKLKIPLPPLDQQKKIAAILDAADSYRQKTKAVIAKYDELTQSLFLDMFGDPVKNPKNLEVISLVDYGSFKNGLNFGRNESGVKLKYLGVGSFKSFYKIDDLDTLSSIELNILPSEGYLLKDGDLVFVRSNGNKALVGRCVEITCGSTKVTFSGFCIRYRVTSDKVNPSYLSQLFRNKSFKSLMLQGGRGANIQNINQKILSEIRIPVPEISLQNKFIRNIKAIELQKTQAEASLVQAENLFNSLLQKAFKGELVS